MSDPAPTHRGDHIPPEILSSEIPIGRELGILFGFLIASLVIMSVYAVVWRGMFLSLTVLPYQSTYLLIDASKTTMGRK